MILSRSHFFSSDHFFQIISVIICKIPLSLAFFIVRIHLQQINLNLKGLCHGLLVHFVCGCQLRLLIRDET